MTSAEDRSGSEKALRSDPSRPPLSCRTSPPRGGRSAFITDFANTNLAKKDAVREAADLPPKWGRCPAGQRGAPRSAIKRFCTAAAHQVCPCQSC
ncbi:MAG: hypothetical protein EOS18_07320 [Mesorhizobium sp.]|nr:MAG: hypothetical protein EOS18_07320 [Mesorhizobium sp.]